MEIIISGFEEQQATTASFFTMGQVRDRFQVPPRDEGTASNLYKPG